MLIAHERDSPSKLVDQASSRGPRAGVPERLVGPAFLLLCLGSTHNPAQSVTVLSTALYFYYVCALRTPPATPDLRLRGL